MVNAQVLDGHLANGSIHEEEPIIEDLSVFNGGHIDMPEQVVQEVVIPPQGDQVSPGLEGGRRAVSCPPIFQGDIFNPKARP